MIMNIYLKLLKLKEKILKCKEGKDYLINLGIAKVKKDQILQITIIVIFIKEKAKKKLLLPRIKKLTIIRKKNLSN